MSVRYLIRKGSYWYRPNAQGYTADVRDAGRYTLEEAENYTHPNGPDGPRDGLSFVRASEALAALSHAGLVECDVMVCPQCEGEGGYPDGLDEAACHTDCTRCAGNGWIVDLARAEKPDRINSAALADLIADTADHPEPETDAPNLTETLARLDKAASQGFWIVDGLNIRRIADGNPGDVFANVAFPAALVNAYRAGHLTIPDGAALTRELALAELANVETASTEWLAGFRFAAGVVEGAVSSNRVGDRKASNSGANLDKDQSHVQ